jgi:hypothetical protein
MHMSRRRDPPPRAPPPRRAAAPTALPPATSLLDRDEAAHALRMSFAAHRLPPVFSARSPLVDSIAGAGRASTSSPPLSPVASPDEEAAQRLVALKINTNVEWERSCLRELESTLARQEAYYKALALLAVRRQTRAPSCRPSSTKPGPSVLAVSASRPRSSLSSSARRHVNVHRRRWQGVPSAISFATRPTVHLVPVLPGNRLTGRLPAGCIRSSRHDVRQRSLGTL